MIIKDIYYIFMSCSWPPRLAFRKVLMPRIRSELDVCIRRGYVAGFVEPVAASLKPDLVFLRVGNGIL